jgi:hypothetical protein
MIQAMGDMVASGSVIPRAGRCIGHKVDLIQEDPQLHPSLLNALHTSLAVPRVARHSRAPVPTIAKEFQNP